MSLKKIVGIIGGVALLASTAGGLKGNTRTSLDCMVAQETFYYTFTSTVRQAQTPEEQKYVQVKELFVKYSFVGTGTLDSVKQEYNSFYRNICTVFSLRDVLIHKINNNVLYYKGENQEKVGTPEAKRWVDSLDQPVNMTIAYKAIKPGEAIDPAVLAAAQKAGLAQPTTDENTPALVKDTSFIFFGENISAGRGTRRGLVEYLPATQENLDALKKVFGEYKKS